jgi:hypothetical protein
MINRNSVNCKNRKRGDRVDIWVELLKGRLEPTSNNELVLHGDWGMSLLIHEA